MKYTKESLQNTWCVVESKEHAEFIIELAMSSDLVFYDDKDEIECNYFTFNEKSKLFFYEYEDELNKVRCKQITIPLPPEAKEWPQIGDEVSWGACELIGTVKAVNGDQCWVLRPDNDCMTIRVKHLSKPKSKEDLLTEELQIKLCNNNYVDNFTLASDIINGMIPGLSYNSDVESAVKGVINKYLDGDA